MSPRILVAGIGNVFFGDDGFGVVAANRLARLPWPEGISVEDYGIRGIHLAYQLCQGYDVLVLVDALPLGNEPPGTVVLLEPDTPPPADPDAGGPVMDAHTMSPLVVLCTLSHLGGSVGRVYVVGCQPETIEEGMGLSQPVAEAVDHAVLIVSNLLTALMGDRPANECQPAGRETQK